MTPELIQFHAGGLSARTLNAEQFKQLRELIGDDYLMVSRAGDAISVSLNTQKFLAKVPQLGALLMVTSAAPGDGKYFGVVVLGDPTDVSPNTPLSLPDNGELSDNITVLIENVPENNLPGHAFTSFPFFALGELSGTCDESTAKRMWRMSRMPGLTVGYDHCGTQLALYPSTTHLDFNAEHFTLYQIPPATRGEVAVYWRGFDVKTQGYCQDGQAPNVEIIEFVNAVGMPVAGTTLPVCTTVTPTTAHRTNSACGPASLAQAAAVSHSVTIPNSYVYLPPYVPPVTTPPTTVPPSSPPTIVYIIPSLLPGAGGSTDPPYLTTIGDSGYIDVPSGATGTVTISGSSITVKFPTLRYPVNSGLLQASSGAGADLMATGSCS